MKKNNLNENWQYRIASNSGAQTQLESAWKKTHVPGNIHLDLLVCKEIPGGKFKEYVPRFMNEYGLQSMPDVKTFLKFSLPEDWELQSEVMQAHQRQYPNPKRGQKFGGFGIMKNYLKNEYHIPEDFEMFREISP